MKKIVISTALTLVAATPFSTQGGEIPEGPNRLSLGARIGYNFKADFRNRAPINPGPAAGGVNHTYNDGYVLLDSSGNAGGLTWNWGYQNGSQVVGDTIQYNALGSGGPSGWADHKVSGDPQYGGELIYQRIFGDRSSGAAVNWGLEAGFGYTELDLHDKRSSTGPVTITTDTFQLNGVIPPAPGYNGTFAGPGPLLGDTPTRSTGPGTATLTSKHKLKGQLFGIRLGPFAEWNLTSKLSLAGSAGLALAPTVVEYDFTETAALAGIGTSVATGHASKTRLLYGYYVSALVRYEFNHRWGLYAGAQFQSLNDLEISAGSRTATLDPGATIYATAGASLRF